MKYLFQQMIAFLAIILTILIVVAISFTQFTKKTMVENSYQQLINYAETAKKNAQYSEGSLYSDRLISSMRMSSLVLNGDNVDFYYINSNRTVSYPNAGTLRREYVSTSDWNAVKSGKTVKMIGKLKDIRLAMVITPLFEWSVVNGEAVPSFSGAVMVTQPVSSVEGSLKNLTGNMLKGFFLSIIIALIVSYILAKFQVNRINRMRKATHQIAHGNFDIHLETKENDELDELAEDFNKMAVALQDSHEEIEHQEELRRQFMADAAHEMRTPLTTINGLLEGLEYNAIPENQKKKCIELMQNETNRLIRLVNENLDYEKIRTNQISMVIQKFNATETLKSLVDQLSGKAEASSDELVLVADEEIEVYADYDRFVQIMVNIIQNAIQFTQNGTITILIEKGYLETVISISDTGIGMTPDEVQNIWDRYYKADPSRKNTKYGESGLGLSIVHQLVKLHHGKIEVDSQKDVGTTFKIAFPDVELIKNKEEPKT